MEGVPVRVKVSPGRVKVEHADAARGRRPHRAPSARGRHQGRSCLAPTRRVRRRAARTPAWARRGHCLGHGAAEGPDTGVAGRDPSRRPFPGVRPVPWMSWHPQRPDHPGSHQPTRRTGPTRSGWPGWRPPISTPPGPRPAPVWPPGAVIPWAASSVRPCWACATPSTDAPTTRWPSSRRPEAIPPMTTSTTSGSIPTIRSARRSSSDPGPRLPDPRPRPRDAGALTSDASASRASTGRWPPPSPNRRRRASPRHSWVPPTAGWPAAARRWARGETGRGPRPD